jgi:hypothetical protein
MKLQLTESQIHKLLENIKDIDEDLFLKKDAENKKLVIFSDLDGGTETFKLKEKFKELGFTWDALTKNWVGDYDKLVPINELIKKHNKTKEVVEDIENLIEFVRQENIDPTSKELIVKNLMQYVHDLANATDAAAMDSAIRNYLTFYSRFHNYSFNNSIMIMIQRPDATKVASKGDWAKRSRGLKKGAKAIWIWRPNMVKAAPPGTKWTEEKPKTDDGYGEIDKAIKQGDVKKLSGFALAPVYDIADTVAFNEKGEAPEQPKWFSDNEPSEVAEDIIKRIKVFTDELGIKVTKETAKGGEKGYSAGGHINLTSDISGVGEASTLVHELAHELLHWKKKSPFYTNDEEANTRAMKELQAESVSYVVLKHYGLPVKHHPTYLALWKANSDRIRKNMDIITKCAKYIIEGIDNAKLEN